MKYDTASLEVEMQIAGITAHRDWRSDGTASTHDRPLTPAEQATAQAVLAAHDPEARRLRRQADLEELARLRIDQEAVVPGTVAEWNTLTPAQRNEALWRGLRIQWLMVRTIGPP